MHRARELRLQNVKHKTENAERHFAGAKLFYVLCSPFYVRHVPDQRRADDARSFVDAYANQT